MPNIDSIYVRTSQGRITAFDTASSLPSYLRTLLRAVDGHTSMGTLSSQFAHGPDVVNLLEQLHQAGLIKEKIVTNSTALWKSPEQFDPRQPKGWPATVPVGLDFGKPALSV